MVTSPQVVSYAHKLRATRRERENASFPQCKVAKAKHLSTTGENHDIINIHFYFAAYEDACPLVVGDV